MSPQINELHPDYITVLNGMSGNFAAYLRWYDDMGIEGGYDVMNTGIGRYKSIDKARVEATQWAEAEGISTKW